jgi:hypothetical protein
LRYEEPATSPPAIEVTAGRSVLMLAASATPPMSRQIRTRKGRVSSALKKILNTCFIAGSASQSSPPRGNRAAVCRVYVLARHYHIEQADARCKPNAKPWWIIQDFGQCGLAQASMPARYAIVNWRQLYSLRSSIFIYAL